MNDPEKGIRNCGAEDLDKSVINKRQSLRIDQSLTEARKNHLIIWSHCSSRRPVNIHTSNLPKKQDTFMHNPAAPCSAHNNHLLTL